ncbi:MAG: HAD-IA family hydrolase [Pseudomonadota bacterium]
MPYFLPRAILFDLDGTLVDTAPDLAAAVNRMRIEQNLPPAPYSVLRPVASAGARGLIEAAYGIGPDDAAYDALRHAFLHNYAAALAVDSVIFDGILELLSTLSAMGIAWGIVTNKAARLTGPLVKLIGLQQAACVISGDTTPHSKPHPEPLFEAARRLNLAPELCWYVGDDLRDIQAGHAAGMFTIAVGWGYGGEVEPQSWQADLFVNDPLQLSEKIREIALQSSQKTYK